MTTLTLSPASRAPEVLHVTVKGLPNDLFGQTRGDRTQPSRPRFARRFLVALVRSLAAPAA